MRGTEENAIKRRGRYKLTSLQEQRLLELQGFKCGMCECSLHHKEPGEWVIDHTHVADDLSEDCATEVRGILCRGCNLLLGHMGDSLAGVLLTFYCATMYLTSRRAAVAELVFGFGECPEWSVETQHKWLHPRIQRYAKTRRGQRKLLDLVAQASALIQAEVREVAA